MEAAAMGLQMKEFAPLFMQSQLAGLIDYNFSSSNGVNSALSDLLKIPLLMQNPRTIIETLYWIDDILSTAEETDNKTLLLTQAYQSGINHTPKVLLALPLEENKNVDELSYAYYLGYIYRCECLLHDESSRMVYSAFPENIMRESYTERQENLSDCAREICDGLDRLLVQKWKQYKNYKEAFK